MSSTIFFYKGAAERSGIITGGQAVSPSAVDAWHQALADQGWASGGSGDDGWSDTGTASAAVVTGQNGASRPAPRSSSGVAILPGSDANGGTSTLIAAADDAEGARHGDSARPAAPTGTGSETGPDFATARRTTAPQKTERTDSNAARGTDAAEKAARAVVKADGSATDADADLVVKRLAQTVPASTLERLAKAGVKVVVTRDSIAEYFKSKKGERPRGWPPGSNYSQVAGIYNPGTKEPVVATKPDFGTDRRLPGVAESQSVDVLLHEVGHAINYTANGSTSWQRQSDADDFRKAYDADKVSIRGYYAQPGDAGRDETFAEAYARFLTNPDAMKREWPNLYSYFQSMSQKR